MKENINGTHTAELDRRDQVTATNSWPSSPSKRGAEVDYQVAAPTESSTPNLRRTTIPQQRVRMEGVATEARLAECEQLGNRRIKDKKPKNKKREKMKEKA